MSRLVGPAALALGLATLAPVLGQGPGTAHAAPAPDCATAYPVADLVDGQTVNGLTVSEGTTPEPFTGEVLGVLEDGISPGLDMIMMRLDSAAIAAAGGIWQGMSGSPVYDDATGDLIGAVAYGLAWGTTPVAGVTPFEDMDDYLASPLARKVDLSRAEARTISATGDVTTSQARQGFRRLPVPMGISGVDADRLAGADRRPYITRDATGIGRSDPAAADADALVAGGNLAAALSLGDVTAAGVGTVTSVCDGRIVGFGHPMQFAGPTGYGLAAADAIYVQEDPLGVPFKLANVGALAGTITDDRLTGISGTFDSIPTAIPFTSDLTFGSRHRVGETDVLVSSSLANIAFAGSLGNHDRVFDEVGPGSETQDWLIEGTDATGAPFTITHADRYLAEFDLAFEASYGLADVLWVLSGLPGVSVTSVTSTADLSRDTDAYTIRKVEQRKRSGWVDVTRHPAKVQAGRTLRLRLTLVSAAGTRTVPVNVDMPRRLSGTRGRLSTLGGNDIYSEGIFGATSLDDVIAELDGSVRNDQVRSVLRIGRGDRKLRTTLVSAALDRVVRGDQYVAIVVR